MLLFICFFVFFLLKLGSAFLPRYGYDMNQFDSNLWSKIHGIVWEICGFYAGLCGLYGKQRWWWWPRWDFEAKPPNSYWYPQRKVKPNMPLFSFFNILLFLFCFLTVKPKFLTHLILLLMLLLSCVDWHSVDNKITKFLLIMKANPIITLLCFLNLKP